ncbi:MAG: hypothetical protein AAF850_02595 [Pseudomonadota bacterium]
MGALTSIAVGVAAVVGAVALARVAEKRVKAFQDAFRDTKKDDDIVELTQDPVSGAYRLDQE